MKYVLITDQHFGLKNESEKFHENFQLFYDKVFFPYLEKSGIKNIIHLGDVFHARKKIDTQTLALAKRYFFDRLEAMDIKVDILLGNHDVYYKESNVPNAPALVLKNYKNVTVYDSYYELGNILLLPWINKNNAEDVYDILKSTKCNVVMAHLELKGFKLNKKTTTDFGMSPKIFSRFDMVLSGHFHTKHSIDHIHYLGAPTEHTWIDVNDKKGFHEFDSKTLDLKFIENPYTMFTIMKYEENVDIDLTLVENRYVKLYADGIEDRTHLNSLVDKIEKVCYDLTLIEDSNVDLSTVDSENIEVEDTSEIIKNYVLQLENIPHQAIYDLMNKAYLEANSI